MGLNRLGYRGRRCGDGGGVVQRLMRSPLSPYVDQKQWTSLSLCRWQLERQVMETEVGGGISWGFFTFFFCLHILFPWLDYHRLSVRMSIYPSIHPPVCLLLQGLTVRVEETKDRAF